MLGKIQEVKQKMEEVKKELETVTETVESAGGAIRIVINGNRKIQSLSISEELRLSSKQELEEQVLVAINKAIEKADAIAESRMKSVAMGMIPPGLF